MAICLQSAFKPINLSPHSHSHSNQLTQKSPFICNLSLSSYPTLTTEPTPTLSSVTTFAPATIANLGPGFDFLGCAVDGLGDFVSLSVDPTIGPGQLSISSISGNYASKLSKDPLNNCAGISALAAMKLLNIRSVGLSLSLQKGLPLGSGLGSSAASAAAGAAAVNALFGSPLSDLQLVDAGLESETKVSGYHADNIAPSIMGGFVLIRNYTPLDLMKLEFPDLPGIRGANEEDEGRIAEGDWNATPYMEFKPGGALVAAVLMGDVEGLGKALSGDRIVEPTRAPLIPGMGAVKKAAVAAGAYGCTISGAGPTAVAVTDDEEKGKRLGRGWWRRFRRKED
ncbi:Homoserine kinase [Bienertia sinuspersici]